MYGENQKEAVCYVNFYSLIARPKIHSRLVAVWHVRENGCTAATHWEIFVVNLFRKLLGSVLNLPGSCTLYAVWNLCWELKTSGAVTSALKTKPSSFQDKVNTNNSPCAHLSSFSIYQCAQRMQQWKSRFRENHKTNSKRKKPRIEKRAKTLRWIYYY